MADSVIIWQRFKTIIRKTFQQGQIPWNKWNGRKSWNKTAIIKNHQMVILELKIQ